MSQPTKKLLQTGHPFGAKVVTSPQPGGAPVYVQRGDVVAHLQPGWHVCVAPAGTSVSVPQGGLPAGASDDTFHWCTGPTYSAMGVPQAAYSGTFDNPSSFGTDGRILNPDGSAK